ncbi:hypothetical protein Pcinc_027266 [Petrolisthes cinctipes]|uniref:Uncharacterized protein n=1 Tax=Petrolisthes cinctipes TaxID=88211 RepID=A0AAE1K931_PETCI|nr:hypothetical protein Pcinc_027266 [Petrolisthes cinctipes]
MTRVGEGESGLSNLQDQVEGGQEVWGGVTVVAVLHVHPSGRLLPLSLPGVVRCPVISGAYPCSYLPPVVPYQWIYDKGKKVQVHSPPITRRMVPTSEPRNLPLAALTPIQLTKGTGCLKHGISHLNIHKLPKTATQHPNTALQHPNTASQSVHNHSITTAFLHSIPESFVYSITVCPQPQHHNSFPTQHSSILPTKHHSNFPTQHHSLSTTTASLHTTTASQHIIIITASQHIIITACPQTNHSHLHIPTFSPPCTPLPAAVPLP